MVVISAQNWESKHQHIPWQIKIDWCLLAMAHIVGYKGGICWDAKNIDTYVYTCVYTYLYTNVYTYMTYVCMYIYIYIYTFTETNICVYIYIYTYVQILIYLHIDIIDCIMCMYICIYIYIYICVCTYATKWAKQAFYGNRMDVLNP